MKSDYTYTTFTHGSNFAGTDIAIGPGGENRVFNGKFTYFDGSTEVNTY